MATEAGTYLTVAEVADLLRLKERRVYALARTGTLPARRVTGRLLFARVEIESWLREQRKPQAAAPAPAILAGSHDPLLDWALRESGSGIASFCDGSLDGLLRLADGEASMAGVHLAEADGTEWNVGHVREMLGDAAVVVLEWAWRDRGLIAAAGNPLGIAGLAGLSGRRLVARQDRAGSQLLLESLLRIDGGALAGEVAHIARNEADAALAVADGKGDATFGLLCMARQFRLDFIPVLRERFDIVVHRRDHFEPPFQRLLKFCRTSEFIRKASELGGYDLSGQFAIHFNSP